MKLIAERGPTRTISEAVIFELFATMDMKFEIQMEHLTVKYIEVVDHVFTIEAGSKKRTVVSSMSWTKIIDIDYFGSSTCRRKP